MPGGGTGVGAVCATAASGSSTASAIAAAKRWRCIVIPLFRGAAALRQAQGRQCRAADTAVGVEPLLDLQGDHSGLRLAPEVPIDHDADRPLQLLDPRADAAEA